MGEHRPNVEVEIGNIKSVENKGHSTPFYMVVIWRESKIHTWL
jgi:hypothetical protein